MYEASSCLRQLTYKSLLIILHTMFNQALNVYDLVSLIQFLNCVPHF
jgi:hypothetical protein